MSERKVSKANGSENTGRTVAEWTTLGMSLVILVALLATITWLWLEGDSKPTTVEITPLLDAVRQEGDYWYLPIEVTNRGEHTAEEVIVEAQLDSGDGEPESAEVTFTFLATGETERGTVVFTSDPTSADLTFRPVSFKEP